MEAFVSSKINEQLSCMVWCGCEVYLSIMNINWAKYSLLLLLPISLMVVFYQANLAGNNSTEPLMSFDQIMPGMIMWSNDSKQFLLQNISNSSRPEWYAYDVELQELQISETWPLQPALTEIEQQNYLPYTSENGTASRIYASPDERYWVYTAEVIDPGRDIVKAAVADPSLERHFMLTEHINGIISVLWSKDSSAFIINTGIFPESRHIWHGSGYENDLSEIVLHDPQIESSEKFDYAQRGAYDLSSDGRFILLKISEYDLTEKTGTLHLYLYDVANPILSKRLEGLDAGQVIAASFSPDDESKLWLFNEKGIVEYDITTGSQIIMDTQFRATEMIPWLGALFSPDGRYLAVLQESGLYVIEISVIP